jgi:hypothetical protein
LQLTPFHIPNPAGMTKDELIALAAKCKATIQVAYTITVYAITRDGIDNTGDRPDDYSEILVKVTGEDGGTYAYEAYFASDRGQIDLNDDEVERVREAISDLRFRQGY